MSYKIILPEGETGLMIKETAESDVKSDLLVNVFYKGSKISFFSFLCLQRFGFYDYLSSYKMQSLSVLFKLINKLNFHFLTYASSNDQPLKIA